MENGHVLMPNMLYVVHKRGGEPAVRLCSSAAPARYDGALFLVRRRPFWFAKQEWIWNYEVVREVTEKEEARFREGLPVDVSASRNYAWNE